MSFALFLANTERKCISVVVIVTLSSDEDAVDDEEDYDDDVDVMC